MHRVTCIRAKSFRTLCEKCRQCLIQNDSYTYVTAVKLNNWDALTSETEVKNRLKHAMFTLDSFHLPASIIRVTLVGRISVGTGHLQGENIQSYLIPPGDEDYCLDD